MKFRRQPISARSRANFVRWIAASLILSAPMLAGAAAWEAINQDVGKFLLYLDRSSVVRKGDTVSAWLLFDFDKAQDAPSGFDRYQSIKLHVLVRCADRSYARTEVSMYSGSQATGTVVGTHVWKSDERKFTKEQRFTNSQAMVDFVCDRLDFPGTSQRDGKGNGR